MSEEEAQLRIKDIGAHIKKVNLQSIALSDEKLESSAPLRPLQGNTHDSSNIRSRLGASSKAQVSSEVMPESIKQKIFEAVLDRVSDLSESVSVEEKLADFRRRR